MKQFEKNLVTLITQSALLTLVPDMLGRVIEQVSQDPELAAVVIAERLRKLQARWDALNTT